MMLPQTQPQGSAMGWGTEKPPPPPSNRQQRRISQANTLQGSSSSPQKQDTSPNVSAAGWQPVPPTFGNTSLSASSSFHQGLQQQSSGYQPSPQPAMYAQPYQNETQSTLHVNSEGGSGVENGSAQQQAPWPYYQQAAEEYGHYSDQQGYYSSDNSTQQQMYQQYYNQGYQESQQPEPTEMNQQGESWNQQQGFQHNQQYSAEQQYQSYGDYGNYANQPVSQESYPNEEGGQDYWSNSQQGSLQGYAASHPEQPLNDPSQAYAAQNYQQEQVAWETGAPSYQYETNGQEQSYPQADYPQQTGYSDPASMAQQTPQPPPFEPVELTGLSFGSGAPVRTEPIVARRPSESKAARSSSPPRRPSEVSNGPSAPQSFVSLSNGHAQAPSLFAAQTTSLAGIDAGLSVSHPVATAKETVKDQTVKPTKQSPPHSRLTSIIPEEPEMDPENTQGLRVQTGANDDADAESGAIYHSQDFSSLTPLVSPARSRRRSSAAKSPSRGRSPARDAAEELPARNDITALQNGIQTRDPSRSRSRSPGRSLSPSKQAHENKNFAFQPGEVGSSPRLPDTLTNIYVPPSPKSKNLVVAKNQVGSSVTSIMSHQRMSVLYDWIIPNYDVNYIQNANNAEDKLSSYPFGSENLRYQAILYPKGVMEGQGTHLSAFLRPIKNADEIAVGDQWTRPVLCFTFRVKKMFENGAEEELLLEEMSEPSFEAFSEGVPGWGFAKFMPLEYVKEALYEGKLHVEIEVIWDCDVPVHRIEHLQVGDYANRLIQKHKGEMVSNVFGSEGMQYQLIVYPSGDEENLGCVGVFIKPVLSHAERAVGQFWARSISNLTIQIVRGRDVQDAVLASKSLTGGFTFNAKSPKFGWGKLCEHKVLSGVDAWSVFCSINYDDSSNHCHVAPHLKQAIGSLQEKCQVAEMNQTTAEKKAEALSTALNKVQRELEQSAAQLTLLKEKQRSKIDSYMSEVEVIRENALAQHEEWTSKFHLLSSELQERHADAQGQAKTTHTLSHAVAEAKSRLARILMTMENDSHDLLMDVQNGHSERLKVSDYKKLQDRVQTLNVELVRLRSNVTTLHLEKETMEKQVKQLELQSCINGNLQAQVALSPLRSPGGVSDQGDEPMDLPSAMEALRNDMESTRSHLEEVKAKVAAAEQTLPTTERTSMNAELSMKQTELELSRAALEDAEDNARIAPFPIDEQALEGLKKEHDYLRLQILDFMAYLGSSVDVNAGTSRYTGYTGYEEQTQTQGQYAVNQDANAVPDAAAYDPNAYQNYQGYPYYQNYQSGVYDPSYVNTTTEYPPRACEYPAFYPSDQGDPESQIQAYKADIDRLNMELNELRGKAFAATEILSGPSRSSQGSPIHPSLQGRLSVASYGYQSPQYPPVEYKSEPEIAPLSLLSVDAPPLVDNGAPPFDKPAPPPTFQKPPLAKPPPTEPKKPEPDTLAEPEYKYEEWGPPVHVAPTPKQADPEELMRILKRTQLMNSIKNTLVSMIFFMATLFFSINFLCTSPTTELTDVGLSHRHAQVVSGMCQQYNVVNTLDHIKNLWNGHVGMAGKETLSSVSRGLSWIQDKGVPNGQRNIRIIQKKWNKSVKRWMNSDKPLPNEPVSSIVQPGQDAQDTVTPDVPVESVEQRAISQETKEVETRESTLDASTLASPSSVDSSIPSDVSDKETSSNTESEATPTASDVYPSPGFIDHSPSLENSIPVIEPGLSVSIEASVDSTSTLSTSETSESELPKDTKDEANDSVNSSVTVSESTETPASETLVSADPTVNTQAILESLKSDLEPRLQVQQVSVGTESAESPADTTGSSQASQPTSESLATVKSSIFVDVETEPTKSSDMSQDTSESSTAVELSSSVTDKVETTESTASPSLVESSTAVELSSSVTDKVETTESTASPSQAESSTAVESSSSVTDKVETTEPAASFSQATQQTSESSVVTESSASVATQVESPSQFESSESPSSVANQVESTESTASPSLVESSTTVTSSTLVSNQAESTASPSQVESSSAEESSSPVADKSESTETSASGETAPHASESPENSAHSHFSTPDPVMSSKDEL